MLILKATELVKGMGTAWRNSAGARYLSRASLPRLYLKLVTTVYVDSMRIELQLGFGSCIYDRDVSLNFPILIPSLSHSPHFNLSIQTLT